MRNKDKNIKVISPCFCVKEDTLYAIQMLSQITGLSRNSIVEIALCEVEEHDLSPKTEFPRDSRQCEETQTLFDFK